MTVVATNSLIIKFYNNIFMEQREISTSRSIEEANPIELVKMAEAVKNNIPSQDFDVVDELEKQGLIDFLNNEITTRGEWRADGSHLTIANVPTALGL